MLATRTELRLGFSSQNLELSVLFWPLHCDLVLTSRSDISLSLLLASLTCLS